MSSSRGTACLTWSDACTTCEAAGDVGDKVTIQIGCDQHIELLWVAHKLHACILGRHMSRQVRACRLVTASASLRAAGRHCSAGWHDHTVLMLSSIETVSTQGDRVVLLPNNTRLLLQVEAWSSCTDSLQSRVCSQVLSTIISCAWMVGYCLATALNSYRQQQQQQFTCCQVHCIGTARRVHRQRHLGEVYCHQYSGCISTCSA